VKIVSQFRHPIGVHKIKNMKQIKINILLLLLLSFCLFSVNSFAQTTGTTTSERIQFGMKAGINFSNVYDSKGEQFNADGKIGAAGGVFISIPLGKYLGIQPEILFSQKGFKATGSLLGSNYTFTRTTNYIDIPLLLAIKPTSVITILAGPQYSYLMKQKDVFVTSVTSVEQQKVFENDNIRKNTLCFVGGADINLAKLVLSARAGWDIQNNNGDGTSTTPRYKNVWYQATIGYRF
jgi:hypothetical protein